MNQRYLYILYFICLSATAFAGQEPGVTPAVNVEFVTPIFNTQPRIFVGTVEGAETVNIVARISGALEKVNFREGGTVQAGDVLFEIEDTVYAANVRVAEALIKQSEADYDLAFKEHERSKELLASKAIAAQTFDTTLATMNLNRAKLEEAKANLVLAQHDLDHCRVTSPISGRIGEKMFSEGNYITPSVGTLATVVQYQPIKVRFSISEDELFTYFSGREYKNHVNLSIIRANGEPYQGTVELDFIDNLVDSRTDTITLHLVCDNAGDQLLPGGFVRVQLAERYEQPLPSVLTSAIMTDGSHYFVYAVGDDNTVERREIIVGDLVGRRQAVVNGLQIGERVVVGGLNKIVPGVTVNPVMVQE